VALTGSTLRPRSVAYKTRLAHALRERALAAVRPGRIQPGASTASSRPRRLPLRMR
jgi:hypothetical protein